MPIVVIIASRGVDKWAREKIINGVERTIAFVGHTFFLVSDVCTGLGSGFCTRSSSPSHLVAALCSLANSSDLNVTDLHPCLVSGHLKHIVCCCTLFLCLGCNLHVGLWTVALSGRGSYINIVVCVTHLYTSLYYLVSRDVHLTVLPYLKGNTLNCFTLFKGKYT